MVMVVIGAILVHILQFIIFRYWDIIKLQNAFDKKWQISVDDFENKEIEFETSRGKVMTNMSKYQNGLVKIYWDLNGMKQNDPIF